MSKCCLPPGGEAPGLGIPGLALPPPVVLPPPIMLAPPVVLGELDPLSDLGFSIIACRNQRYKNQQEN